MDDRIVTLKHGSKEWQIRAAVLCACSSVLSAILLDSDPEGLKELTMDDVQKESVDVFLALASSISHDTDSDFPSVQELAKQTRAAMPLVHKYDCRGLLKMLQSAQNQQPDVDGIMAIIEHEPAVVDWLGEKAKTALIAHLFRPCEGWEFKKQKCVDEIASMPDALLRLLFAYTMLDAGADFTQFSKQKDGSRAIPSYCNIKLRGLVPRQ